MALLTDTYKTLNNSYSFYYALKIYPQEGNLVYEYNPFYNYRLEDTMIYYKERLWSLDEFCAEFGITHEGNGTTGLVFKDNEGNVITSWSAVGIPATETEPIVYLAGLLVDFETDELHFDLNHPVNLLPLYSYDNSVNLIINDGINPPRLINSRWSATERNQYQVCDRKGDNDSNIYDQGALFDIDTSLYKKITKIPEIQYVGVFSGGNLSVGNYHFYFRYVDADGNMSDFFGESGLVSIFIGNTTFSIYQGFADENAHKGVKFTIDNMDPGYSKIVIYYTRATSDILQNAVVNAYKIDREWLVTSNSSTLLTITGYEEVSLVTIEEINPLYQVYGSAETLASAKNMLFLGNVDKPKIDYDDFADCALRFLPYLDTSVTYDIDKIGSDYTGSTNNTYYDPDFIYNYTGYHYDEIYRFGIVFILSDNTLSEVYNVRGIGEIPLSLADCAVYTLELFWDTEEEDQVRTRVHISYDELYYNINNSSAYLENAKGVVYIPYFLFNKIAGIRFTVPQQVLDYLQEVLGVIGFFFVRLKRIPTTLCEAYTIGIDNQSNTPVIPCYYSRYNRDAKVNEEWDYLTESFLNRYELKSGSDDEETDDSRLLTHDLSGRLRGLIDTEVRVEGALCPEYDINSPYLNSLFTGELTTCNVIGEYNLTRTDNYFVMDIPKDIPIGDPYNVHVIGVEDNTKLVEISGSLFSARAGEAEEAFRYEYIGSKEKYTECDNLLRGSYGPFLGITGYDYPNTLISIKIPGYSITNMSDYFEIRYHDKDAFYAISDRFDMSQQLFWVGRESVIFTALENKEIEYTDIDETFYRGDCYICQFTHRLNRNFQDPSSPTNDEIVDPKCWKKNYEVEDDVVKSENFEDINLGDVNAIKLGLYVTLFVRSTYNLNVRALDDSYVDEVGMFGHARGFYPYFGMNNSGAYKIPEALCVNKGFERSLSEKVLMEAPDVPWIKNEFSNRIAYSNIDAKDQFDNGWRTFEGTHYRDYSKEYGSITKLIEYLDNLLCVFEHGVAVIAINERAVAAEGLQGLAYINTNNVLPDTPNILSGTYGSLWRDSVIKTDIAVYGVDTVAKKIWRATTSSFELISDFKILEFLNKNISLTERELTPIMGIRNVKTHYNAYKKDVMFTFYDNLYGFEEKVWNVCWNELLLKWITFYSWVPSYSENIYNSYFSFDRNTSKWIAKLGVSHADNDFSDGVCLEDNFIPNNGKIEDIKTHEETHEEVNQTYTYYVDGEEYSGTIYWRSKLSLENRTLPEGTDVSVSISYLLDRDNFLNFKNFIILEEQVTEQTEENETALVSDTYYLALIKDPVILCCEYYQREIPSIITSEGDYIIKDLSIEDQYNHWVEYCVKSDNSNVYKENGNRINLDEPYNKEHIVTLLNIRANMKVSYASLIVDVAEAYNTDTYSIDAGYYESVVAVTPNYNKQFLTTDFWKHGLSNIIDIADTLRPTYWYGKQHPFEFEFVISENPIGHKIYDNLLIISNSAEPESFHYEIVGDCYDFAEDKKNMYIRQEATKELYLYNGMDTTYDHDYASLGEELRELPNTDTHKLYDKSTLMPLYYSRLDTINEVEDYYHLKDGANTKDFSALSGGEILYYDTLGEYRLWSHAKAVSTNDKGQLRGNMQYKEDVWNVQINPITIVLKNEPQWHSGKVPVEIHLSPLPDEILQKGDIDLPDGFYDPATNTGERAIVSWGDLESQRSEVKIKDKWMKVRIRYTGNKLAVIHSIITMFSISYS